MKKFVNNDLKGKILYNQLTYKNNQLKIKTNITYVF